MVTGLCLIHETTDKAHFEKLESNFKVLEILRFMKNHLHIINYEIGNFKTRQLNFKARQLNLNHQSKSFVMLYLNGEMTGEISGKMVRCGLNEKTFLRNIPMNLKSVQVSFVYCQNSLVYGPRDFDADDVIV